ncbi:XylR family transcriptional regulator [Stieleria maiorica]|uniref:XylR family transcriptional regulator n=1 Tax=Stieleria maiorica TaxID=2795974 RepID=UPI001F2E9C28|nr:DNA-binding transcriptional regulator [Stieleria maiorica]
MLIETSNGYSRGLFEGVIAYTKVHGNWSVYLTEQERGASPPSWLRTWGGDGIIARIETDAIGRQLVQCGVPIVDLSAARHIKGVPWADTEDKAIAKLAFHHFAERGFRNLAYCGDAGFDWSLKRGQHFRQFAESEGYRFFEHQSVARYARTFNAVTEKQRIMNWIRELPRPIGIMGCYDFKAQEVLDACRQMRVPVPTEIAVLGVDNDHLICELSEPTLSSIIPDTKQTGFEAASLLDRMMDGETITDEQPLVTQPLGVKLRESTDTVAIEDEQIAKALQFIRRRASANIRVTDVLEQVDLSRRAFEHRFKKLVGVTPHEEIQRVRMNRAKELLRDTDLTVPQIANLLGFEHSEYLGAAFKREVGVSPGDYRRNSSHSPD